MSLDDNIAQARALLDKISQFERLVAGETFEPDTVADMKSKAKGACDMIKSEVNDIKQEINDWG